MEFIGYHVFNEDYRELTPDQAMFIDYGGIKVYSDMLGGDEKSQKDIQKARRRSRHFRH